MRESLHIIKSEHRNLFRVVNVFDIVLRGLDEGRKPDFPLLDAIIHYIESFPDRYHHPKEDDYLFKALRAREPASHAILDELEEEHKLCAERIDGVRQALIHFQYHYPEGRDVFETAARDYIRFQVRHLQKEEGVVLPMAQRSLTTEDWDPIDQAFLDNKDPLFGDDARDEARALYSKIVNMTPPPHGLGLEQ